MTSSSQRHCRTWIDTCQSSFASSVGWVLLIRQGHPYSSYSHALADFEATESWKRNQSVCSRPSPFPVKELQTGFASDRAANFTDLLHTISIRAGCASFTSQSTLLAWSDLMQVALSQSFAICHHVDWVCQSTRESTSVSPSFQNEPLSCTIRFWLIPIFLGFRA